VRTDNSYLDIKAAMRARHLPEGKVAVLDLFGGRGLVWERVRQMTGRDIEVDGAEIEKDKGDVPFRGNNLKFIPGIDLAEYNVIDVDAYGVPYATMAAVFANGTLSPGTVVFYTLCRSVFGIMPKALLREIGVSGAMYAVAPAFIAKELGMRAWYAWLAQSGVLEVQEVSMLGNATTKRYGVFVVPEGWQGP